MLCQTRINWLAKRPIYLPHSTTPAVVRMEASPRITLTYFKLELPLGSRMRIRQKLAFAVLQKCHGLSENGGYASVTNIPA